MTIKLEGIIPPHITPFKKNGDIDEAALKKLVNFWLDDGVDGLVSCGSNGEAPSMSRDERRRVIDIVINEVNDKVPVIAGTGAPSTGETIDLTRDAKDIGADAALIVTPYFYRPNSEELIEHYRSVIKAVDIPIILYNVPKFTGYNLEADVVIKLAKEYSQIIGVKDSGGSIGQISEIIRQVGKKISVLAGSGDVVLANLMMGGKGGILGIANVAPRLCSDIFDYFKKGDSEKAKEAQMKALFLNDLLIKKYNQLSSIKEAMNQLGQPAGYPRLPSLPLKEEAKQNIQKALHDLNLKKS
ncbi:MAG: hypothetical protein QG670_586 [Thermoproteota archaeon]|nr:hypothetical protein [Thermoproteota archaeon]